MAELSSSLTLFPVSPEILKCLHILTLKLRLVLHHYLALHSIKPILYVSGIKLLELL